MVMRPSSLIDSQGEKIVPLLPKAPMKRCPGDHLKDNRLVFEAILWVLKTGARWRDIHKDFGVSGSACCKRLRSWEEHDVRLDLWRVILAELRHFSEKYIYSLPLVDAIITGFWHL